MCVPGCLEAIARGSGRGLPAPRDLVAVSPPRRREVRRSFTGVVGLTGAHVDAPLLPYADKGASADRLKIEDLVMPLVAGDIAGRPGPATHRLASCPAAGWRRGSVLREREPR